MHHAAYSARLVGCRMMRQCVSVPAFLSASSQPITQAAACLPQALQYADSVILGELGFTQVKDGTETYWKQTSAQHNRILEVLSVVGRC